MGTYKTIKTTKYIDGVLDSYLSCQDEERRIAAQRTLKAEVTSQLMGSKDYQEQVRMAEAELNGGEETGDKEGLLYKSADGGSLEDWEEDDEVYRAETKTRGRKTAGGAGKPPR